MILEKYYSKPVTKPVKKPTTNVKNLSNTTLPPINSISSDSKIKLTKPISLKKLSKKQKKKLKK